MIDDTSTVCPDCIEAAREDADSDEDVCYSRQRDKDAWHEAFRSALVRHVAECEHGQQHEADVAGVARFHAGAL